MKPCRNELWFEVSMRAALTNITPEVLACLRKSRIKDGLLQTSPMHITASVIINDDEVRLHHHSNSWLEILVRHAAANRYHYNHTGDDNTDPHQKR
jgi:thiamine phosphate synthase YjbQ (UPF0047 family)